MSRSATFFATLLAAWSIPLLLHSQPLPPSADDADEQWEYQLIFSDEFDQPNGSLPDATKWQSSRRQGATWNRWIADSSAVASIRSGSLLCRAIPNRDRSVDDVPMITGAMETRDRFSFTYGKVEIRLRTNLYQGNFPAAWMMPQPPADGWPKGGEIDIFESIDDKEVAYHTVHSHWTYDLGHRSDPVSSFSEKMTVSSWHVYALEWTEDALTWLVDGKVVGTYRKSTDRNALKQGQWPFDHPFYIILNQSVGNGSWAKDADTKHTYNTFFDYVRVYQRVPTGIHRPSSPADESRCADIFDLSGRPVSAPLRPGVYFRNNRKFIIH